MAIGERGYDLTARLQQLEIELPLVERTLLSEPNQIRFAYCAGNQALIKLCQTFVIWTHGIYWLLLGHMKSGWKLSRVENCWDLNMITDKCFQALKMWKIGSGSNWHTSIQSDQNHCTQGDLPRFIRNFYEECRGPPRLFLLDKYTILTFSSQLSQGQHEVTSSER